MQQQTIPFSQQTFGVQDQENQEDFQDLENQQLEEQNNEQQLQEEQEEEQKQNLSEQKPKSYKQLKNEAREMKQAMLEETLHNSPNKEEIQQKEMKVINFFDFFRVFIKKINKDELKFLRQERKKGSSYTLYEDLVILEFLGKQPQYTVGIKQMVQQQIIHRSFDSIRCRFEENLKNLTQENLLKIMQYLREYNTMRGYLVFEKNSENRRVLTHLLDEDPKIAINQQKSLMKNKKKQNQQVVPQNQVQKQTQNQVQKQQVQQNQVQKQEKKGEISRLQKRQNPEQQRQSSQENIKKKIEKNYQIIVSKPQQQKVKSQFQQQQDSEEEDNEEEENVVSSEQEQEQEEESEEDQNQLKQKNKWYIRQNQKQLQEMEKLKKATKQLQKQIEQSKATPIQSQFLRVPQHQQQQQSHSNSPTHKSQNNNNIFTQPIPQHYQQQQYPPQQQYPYYPQYPPHHYGYPPQYPPHHYGYPPQYPPQPQYYPPTKQIDDNFEDITSYTQFNVNQRVPPSPYHHAPPQPYGYQQQHHYQQRYNHQPYYDNPVNYQQQNTGYPYSNIQPKSHLNSEFQSQKVTPNKVIVRSPANKLFGQRPNPVQVDNSDEDQQQQQEINNQQQQQTSNKKSLKKITPKPVQIQIQDEEDNDEEEQQQQQQQQQQQLDNNNKQGSPMKQLPHQKQDKFTNKELKALLQVMASMENNMSVEQYTDIFDKVSGDINVLEEYLRTKDDHLLWKEEDDEILRKCQSVNDTTFKLLKRMKKGENAIRQRLKHKNIQLNFEF